MAVVQDGTGSGSVGHDRPSGTWTCATELVPGPVLRALPDYEPSHAPGESQPRRWSSLRPASGPQLTLVAPPPETGGGRHAGGAGAAAGPGAGGAGGRRAVGQLRTLLSDAAFEAAADPAAHDRTGPRAPAAQAPHVLPDARGRRGGRVVEIAGTPAEARPGVRAGGPPRARRRRVALRRPAPAVTPENSRSTAPRVPVLHCSSIPFVAQPDM